MDIKNLKIGDQSPEEINAVVEIPQGSSIKYEIDAQTGKLEVDRLIGSASVYPFSYGFIPETLADDGDALDVMIISDKPTETESIIIVRPIGVLWMEDEHGKDEKILAVPIEETDSAYSNFKDLKDLDLSIQEKIKLFFKQYKEMEAKHWSKVQNFGDKNQAIEAIKRATEKYLEN